MCDFAASTLGGIEQDKVWKYTREVNKKGEVGTFWPRFPLTVLPQSYWEGRYPRDRDHFFEACLKDVALANREHVKLKDMYIDFNDYYGGLFHSGVTKRSEIRTAKSFARRILPEFAEIETLWITPNEEALIKIN